MPANVSMRRTLPIGGVESAPKIFRSKHDLLHILLNNGPRREPGYSFSNVRYLKNDRPLARRPKTELSEYLVFWGIP
jgi:hypothetical protein